MPDPKLKTLFLLDQKIHFLNHGSFGAVPRPVFAAWRRWQRRLEQQPVRFLSRDLEGLLAGVRQDLALEFGAEPEDILLVPNVTYGVNLVARSLALEPGDEVLASDQEYGACDLIWARVCAARGAHYCRQPLPFPATAEGVLADALWSGVTPRTRLIFLSLVTSPTAIRLPVEEICRRARTRGIAVLVDGAHGPGQIPLNLDGLGADYFTGNLHKWAMAPRGAAFLHVRRDRQEALHPLIVSWGDANGSSAGLAARLQWAGTDDPTALLAVPAALEFASRNDWATVRRQCSRLLAEVLDEVAHFTGLPAFYRPGVAFPLQMGVVLLPPDTDAALLKRRLYDEYRVEVPIIEWSGRILLRVSIQGYNDSKDGQALVAGLKALL